MSNTVAVTSEYRSLPLSLLDESSTNPRRTFDPAKLVELAQSIAQSGLIQPITVRPKADRFEIVAGARRYRAAQIAEQSEIPTRVLDLTDSQSLEIQIVENSQRQDVHPYEEASGYQRLLDLPGYDVAALASKCGKSQSHVYARLTLLALIPEIAESFQQESITASHANLLARLTPEQQAQAFPNAFRKNYQDDELQLLPAKSLASWIEDNLYLALADAPFDKESETLLPAAGSCVACPKRSGFNAALFADVAEDFCFDGECFRAKINSHIESAKSGVAELVQISTMWRPVKDRPVGELAPTEYIVIDRPNGEPATTCGSATPAIITHGHGVGVLRVVCADQDCPVHHPSRSIENDDDSDAEWQERQKQAEIEREKKKKLREKRLRSLTLQFPASVTEAQTRFLLTALVMGNLDDAMERIALRLEDGATDGDKSSDDICAAAIADCMPSSLMGYLAELALGSFVDLPREEEIDYLGLADKLFAPAPPAKAVKKSAPAKTVKRTAKK